VRRKASSPWDPVHGTSTAIEIVLDRDDGEIAKERADVRGVCDSRRALREALGYALNQRARLELFLTDTRIPIHNNTSEARLRVIALARHNYLFFGHPRAGRNFAGLYSLVGSCIANDVEPTEYLTDVRPRIRDATTDEQLDALLPDRRQPFGPAP
jgi:hypothetical protein